MDPLTSLGHMFPEVDVRILSGVVREHGSDIESSIIFILREVLTPEQLQARVKLEDTSNHTSTHQSAVSQAEFMNEDLTPGFEQDSAPGSSQTLQMDKLIDAKEEKAVDLHIHTQESGSITGRSGSGKCAETNEGLRPKSRKHGLCGWITEFSTTSTPTATSCPTDMNMDVCTYMFQSSRHPYEDTAKRQRTEMAANNQFTAAGQDSLEGFRAIDDMYGQMSAMQRSSMQGSVVIGFPVGFRMWFATGHQEPSFRTDAFPDHNYFMPTVHKEMNSSGCPVRLIAGAVLNDSRNDDDCYFVDEPGPGLELMDHVAQAAVDAEDSMLEKPGIGAEAGGHPHLEQLNTQDLLCKMQNDEAANTFNLRHDLVVPELLPSVEPKVRSEVSLRTPLCDVKGEPHIDFVAQSNSSYDSTKNRAENFESAYPALANTAAFDGKTREKMPNSSSEAVDINSLDEIVQLATLDMDELVCAIGDIHALQLEIEQVGAAARQARMEAANGGADILAKAEVIRQRCSQIHRANDIYAGEIDEEKTILSCEARELESRLHHVVKEKAKALTQIREVKTMLQSVLERILEEKECANFEKLVKEVTANNVRRVETLLFDKVEQQKKELEYDAEACTKLRDFLIHRGSIADSLEGEVAVLCEDLEVLKTQAEALFASIKN